MHDPITSFVVLVFSTPGVALMMAAALLVFALFLIGLSEFTEYQPLLKELLDRWNMLSGVRSATGRKDFVKRFAEFDLRFANARSAASAPAGLVLGWANYRSLLVENERKEFATSVRAAESFDKLDEPARSLEWWANILVALGLVVTFLGIVAALTEATSAMGQAGGSDSGAMETALMGLLSIAATKFWTSIAGVLASIILRVVARFRRKRIERLEASLFESLDAVVEFNPPEKVMLEQLKTLRRLEVALAPQAAAEPAAKPVASTAARPGPKPEVVPAAPKPELKS